MIDDQFPVHDNQQGKETFVNDFVIPPRNRDTAE